MITDECRIGNNLIYHTYVYRKQDLVLDGNADPKYLYHVEHYSPGRNPSSISFDCLLERLVDPREFMKQVNKEIDKRLKKARADKKE